MAVEWRVVEQDERLKEGDRLQVDHCIQAPNIPFNEVLASLQTSLTNFQQRINDELPDCVTVEVVDKELNRSSGVVVNGDECEFIHTTEVVITDLREGECPQGFMQAGTITSIIGGVLIVLAIFGVTILFSETRKLFSIGPGGEGPNVFPLIALLGVGAFALKQVNDLDDDG